MKFRPGTPDDYVYRTVGYDYEIFSLDHPYVKEIQNFFNKVQTEEDMREYILTLLASHLDGHTKAQKFILWTGSGANGKSTVIEFYQYAFGEYCGVLPITVLTSKRKGSSNATPEIADLRGKRFVVFQEPERDDKIYVGYMKELSGGDWIYARPLFKDPIRFKPQFKMILTCNVLPYIPSTDNGTWRRLRVSPFESEFVDGKPKRKNQFPKDYDLTDKMQEWKKALLWLLINVYYVKYKAEGIKEPTKVTDFTSRYKRKSDAILEYIEDNLDKTGNDDDMESIDFIYTGFREWYKDGNPNRTILNKNDLQEYLMNNNYRCDKTYLYGYKIKGELDEKT